MATKLYLRNTTTNGITDTGDGIVYDLITTAGSSSDTGVVNTAASGTNIQWTKTAGGSTMAWISGRVPSGGFTLTSVDISAWLQESNSGANAKGRVSIYKYTPGTPTITEIGGPFDDDKVELSTSATEDTWTANVTDTAFAENDRILVRFFITNNGTMGGSRTCTLTFNAADAATGDSFATIAETVSFKAEVQALTASLFTNSASFFAPTVSPGAVTLTPSLFSDGDTFFAPTLSSILTPSLYSDGDTFYDPTVETGGGAQALTQAATFTNESVFPPDDGAIDSFWGATVSAAAAEQSLEPPLYADDDTFFSHTLAATYSLTPDLYADDDTFYSATVAPGAITLTPSLFSDGDTFFSATVAATYALTPDLFSDGDTFFAHTLAPTYALTAPLYEDADTFYDPSAAATNTLVPALFADDDTFYTPAISGSISNLYPDLYADGDTFYPAIVGGVGPGVRFPGFASRAVLGSKRSRGTLRGGSTGPVTFRQ